MFPSHLRRGPGAAKTFVLTEAVPGVPRIPSGGQGRALRLDQLTAITFTERAMPARCGSGSASGLHWERLKAAPEEHAGHRLRTLRDLDSARISTIHSFCGTLLSGRTPWRPGSIRTLRSSTLRPPRQFSTS